MLSTTVIITASYVYFHNKKHLLKFDDNSAKKSLSPANFNVLSYSKWGRIILQVALSLRNSQKEDSIGILKSTKRGHNVF